MTVNQIIEEVNQKKKCGRIQVYRYIRRLNIKSIGCRQRPANYPDDTAAKIIAYLGYVRTAAAAGKVGTLTHSSVDDGKIVGLDKLKTVRKDSKKVSGK